MMVLGLQEGFVHLKPSTVSILLVMDDGLGVLLECSAVARAAVSILLVMDDGLGVAVEYS